MGWGILTGRRMMKVKVSRGVRRTGGGIFGVMRGRVVWFFWRRREGIMTDFQCSFILSLGNTVD